MDIENVGSV